MIEARNLRAGDVVVGLGRNLRAVLRRSGTIGPHSGWGKAQILEVTYLLLTGDHAGDIVTWAHSPSVHVEIERVRW